MKKSDFFELVKSFSKKPDSVCILDNSVFVSRHGCYMDKIANCKTEENAAKEMHKFNRWLSEALDTIHHSETQWMHEEEHCCEETPEERQAIASGDFNRFEMFGTDGFKSCPKCHDKKVASLTKLQPGLHQAKVKSVGIVADKVVYSINAGENVISMNNKIHEVKKEKSPAKMFVRATMNVLKQYDCFDSVRNPHWSNMTKKQKKHWARKFGIEMMECQAESYGMDLASDYKNDPISNILMSDSFNLSDIDFYLKHKDYWYKEGVNQLIAEMDYSGIEEYVEENLNCLW